MSGLIPIPENEDARIEALYSHDLLDTPTEGSFNALTRLAARVFSVPMALVSLVDRERQWFKSAHGLDTEETPRSISFCTYAIMQPDPLVVLDALEDDRFKDTPLVTGPPNIRFYAGAPLIDKKGFRLGTFCVIGTKPRKEFLGFERNHLIDFAATTTELIQIRDAT
ncbi:MAG: GAF domain-containing protein [Alphaproteobacteria bacterium]